VATLVGQVAQRAAVVGEGKVGGRIADGGYGSFDVSHASKGNAPAKSHPAG